MPYYYNVSSLNNQVTAATENNAAVDPLGLPALDKSIFNAGVASAQATDSTEATEYKILPNVDTPTSTSTSEDGADDGKISTTEKLKSIGSGLLSPVKTIIKHPIASAAVAVAGLAVGAAIGSAVAPALVAVGAAYGGYKIAKGVYNAATANTDEEAKEAYEGIGSGTADVVLAGGCAKAALGAAEKAGLEVAGDTSTMSHAEALVNCFKATGKSVDATYKTITTEGKMEENIINSAGYAGKQYRKYFKKEAPSGKAEPELLTAEQSRAALASAEKVQLPASESKLALPPCKTTEQLAASESKAALPPGESAKQLPAPDSKLALPPGESPKLLTA